MVDYLLQCVSASDGDLSVLVAGNDLEFLVDVFNALQENQTSGVREISIDRTEFTPEDAIDRHSQGGSFAVHSASAADHQVRRPDQIEAVHHVFRNYGSPVSKHCWPGLAQVVFLIWGARYHHRLDIGMLAQELHDFRQEYFAFRIVVVGFGGRGSDGNDYAISV